MKIVTFKINRYYNERKIIYVFSLLFFVLYFIASNLLPNGDDWGYLCMPQIYENFTVIELFPHQGHWRPIDVLLGWALGFYPKYYPEINHFLCCFAHVLIAFYIYRLIIVINGSFKISLLCSMFFLLHTNVFATTFSIDSVNQSLSLLFGIIAIYVFVKGAKKYFFGSELIWILLSIMSKESGFIFFTATPIIGLILRLSPELRWKDFWVVLLSSKVLQGVLLTCVYFLFIFNFDIFSILNTHDDRVFRDAFYNPFFGTCALVGRVLQLNLPLLINTNFSFFSVFLFIMSLPFYFFIIIEGVRSKMLFKPLSVILIFYILFYSLVHSFFKAITEMNSYPVICLFAILVGFLLSKSKSNLKLNIIVGLLFVCSIFNLAYKFNLIRSLNTKGVSLVRKVMTGSNPKNVFILLIDPVSDGHDIYQKSPLVSIGGGHMMKMFLNNWDLKMKISVVQMRADHYDLVKYGDVVKCHHLRGLNDTIQSIISKNKPLYDEVWVLNNNGEVKVVK
jgi:hypothetical protein